MIRAAAPAVLDRPDVGDAGPRGGWIVTVYDNDVNTVEEVVLVLLAATECDLTEAEMETWEVHHLGKSVVHHGGEAECREVARVIATIGIRVEVTAEG